MSSVRRQIADALATALPSATYTVRATPPAVDIKIGASRFHVSVSYATAAPSPVMQGRAVTCKVRVLTGHEDEEKADDALEPALDALIAALIAAPIGLEVGDAERIVFAERLHGWSVDVTAHTTTIA